MEKSFPMHLWDIILPQAVITLNMLQTSQIHPKLSASTHIDGQYDYNMAPMEPPGTRIIAHETQNCRRRWAPHGKNGSYIGPALEHYRCYTVFITKTRSERVVETVEFSPTEVPLSFPSSQDLVTQAPTQLTHALLNPQPDGSLCQVGDEQMLALARLAAIFKGALPTHKSVATSPLLEIVDNDAPLRVINESTPPMVMQATVTHITTPNSYRKLSPTPCRAVSPTTPHSMIMRSAHQENLSNDMLAETVQHANHVFSLPT
jgi:hypothetical protein